ncbi:anaerobic ribonucleoside-triphosphate reductase activating protein [Flavimobilis marinus]|uniref:Pyruvate formate lyase activating enzyme n=1 Tax=Flavimobilis marinus TaxID=285351 RepID=A0A1I2GYI4_9MICO|nr:anaerobic ribonucleoside-triphosphate reductase activating protein [Flavimobilis marinus]GHG54881.1 anaerobic ribonucleoside-triphosphate reductase activating protein [Flavimobilis marinus]SFF22318.1 pyruvate formate lyase activating enzyme [Flavimobilis marinus]
MSLAAGADTLTVAGLEPFSSCDWPGHLVATVFLQGCPWQCGYCHNVSIIDPRAPGEMSWAEVRAVLERRRGLLDGVVFSGGEPTRQAGLAAAMREVRELGYGVALHTGGAYPRRLAEVLPLVDWVGLDIKAPEAKFAAVTGVANSAKPAFESLRIVLDSGVPLQVRTTLDPTILDDGDVLALRAQLTEAGVRDYVVQSVRTEGASEEFAERLTTYRREQALA